MANEKSTTTARAVDPKARERFKTGDPLIDAVRIYENENKVEDQPRVLPKANEKIIENRHGSSIVLGRDYKYDEENDTGIGMVDIAAGRVANATILGKPLVGDETIDQSYSKGDFKLDAARVYVSQKSSIDREFDLPMGTLGNADNRSAVAMKADAVRIISRDSAAGIKLVVEGENNSRGGDGDSLGGVEIIGANGTNMQPIPKAVDLAIVLEEMINYIQTLENLVVKVVEVQQEFNKQVATEMHISPFYGAPTIPDAGNLTQLGKTSMDYISYVTLEGKKLSTDMEVFKKMTLGIQRTEEGEPVKIKNPSFASKYHKLD
jgi:hypothetical protein